MKLITALLLVLLFLFSSSPLYAQEDPANGQFKEIDAINNRCIGLSPGELCVETKKDDSVFGGIVEKLKSLFISVTTAVNFNEIVPRADVAQKATFPVQEDAGADKVEQLDNSLCGEDKTGVYGAYTPAFADEGEIETQGCEKKFDKSFFPENVNVVIP